MDDFAYDAVHLRTAKRDLLEVLLYVRDQDYSITPLEDPRRHSVYAPRSYAAICCYPGSPVLTPPTIGAWLLARPQVEKTRQTC